MNLSRTLLSIIIPARNEALFLPSCLEAIRASFEQLNKNDSLIDLEIVVVINRCTDTTEKIARLAGCRIVYDDTKNLSHIRNSGVKASSGKFIITIDADSRMGLGMLPAVTEALQSPKIVGGGVIMLPERWSVGIFITFLMLVPLALRHWISGGLFFFHRDDFYEIGGFDEELHSAEDVDFAIRLQKHGRQSGRRFHTILKSLIITSCRKFDGLGDWYFVLHPLEMITLLKGRNRELADKIWYDFKR